MLDGERQSRERCLNLAGAVPVFDGRRAAAVSFVIAAVIAPLVRGALPRMLVGLVAADQASRSSPEQSVMAGIMACHPTDNGTL